MLVGMPLPEHPFDLWLAFTFVSFALLGLGLVIATLADNVPAVQALGQCIFLPMPIIGGVAVQLASLPPWAQHVSAFFPGRYAVDAMQSAVTGDGLGAVRFSLLALLLIGAAGCLAGLKMFRWDAQQRFATRSGKGWVAVALAAWVAVGLLAESRGLVEVGEVTAQARATRGAAAGAAGPSTAPPVNAPSSATPPSPPAEAPGTPAASPAVAAPAEPGPPPARSAKPELIPERRAAATPKPGPAPAPAPPKMSTPPPQPSTPSTTGPPHEADPPEPKSWQEVTAAHLDLIVFGRLPSDSGVVSPIAPADEPL